MNAIPRALALRAKEAIDRLVKLQFQFRPSSKELATAIADAQACSIFLEAAIERAVDRAQVEGVTK